MGRALRPYLPGVAFHLTARVHDRERLLVGLQAPIAGLIRAATRHAGARLVAYVVMSNHLHILVVQGRRPLAECMQPLMRRAALLVQGAHGRTGHVFERRYAARACLDADYMRNAIAYVHLNPVRAGLCGDAADYPWSSHRAYCGAAGKAESHALRSAAAGMLQLFAPTDVASPDDCRAAYLAFMRCRLERDRFLATADDEAADRAPGLPACSGGDAHWARSMAPFAAAASDRDRLPAAPRRSLATTASAALREVEPEMSLDLLRSGTVARPVARARRPVVARCLEEGYTPKQVARFLGVSTSTVSRVSSALRSGNPA